MASTLQLRRGTKAQNDVFTGADGEVTINTDSKSLRTHDGVKAGGYEFGMTQANGMADLRTHTPVIGARRYLTHHTTDGDGGHGVFRSVIGGHTAAQDNNGTVIVVGVNAWVREYSEAVNVRWFGAIGDGVTNDSPAFQSTYNFVVSQSGGSIYIPFSSGGYRLSTVLNFTDTFIPIYIYGDGSANLPNSRPNDAVQGTTLWADTGGVLFDLTGRGAFRLADLTIDGFNTTKAPNPSKIGILESRSTASNSNQDHIFENLKVFLPSTGSSITPSIAKYSYGAELGTAINCWFFADIAIVLTNIPLYSVVSPNTIIAAGAISATDNVFLGCTFTTVSGLGPSLHISQTINNTFIGSYIGNESSVQTFPAIMFTNSTQKCMFSGFQSEGHDTLFEVKSSNLVEVTLDGTHASTGIATPIGKFTNCTNIDGNIFRIYNSSTPVAYNAYTSTGVSTVYRNNVMQLGYTGSVSLTGYIFSNFTFTKQGSNPSLVFTGSATYTMNGHHKTTNDFTRGLSSISISNKANNVSFTLFTINVPNQGLGGKVTFTYTANSSLGQAYVTGEITVNIARTGGYSTKNTIVETVPQVILRPVGAETLPIIFTAVLTGGVGAPQTVAIQARLNSGGLGAGYIRGEVTLLSSYFTNNANFGAMYITT